MFNYDIKFLTCDESLHLKNGDFKSYKYETRKRGEESVYDAGKRSYCERRGGSWRAPSPRQIRQLESKLRDKSIVYCDWTHENLISIIFSSGAIAYLSIKPESLDVCQVLFDRYCVGKLASQTVSSALLCKTHLLFTHSDKTATLISFGKCDNTQPCRISDRDPHVQSIELGGSARRAERHVSWCENSQGVRVLVWGSAAAEPAPWSPAMEDLANLHLYQFCGQQVTLIAYHQLENDTLSAELSYKNDNVIHFVEQTAAHKTGVSLDWTRYEVPCTDERTKLSPLSESLSRVSLPAPARVASRSPCDTRLLVACIDGTLHVIHHIAGLINSTRAGFIATAVRWAGAVVVAAEEGGRLQCFDRALQPLTHHTKCIDLTAQARDSRRLQVLASKAVRGGPLLLMSFVGGPLALLRIMHPRLLTAWIRAGRINNAVALLKVLDWEAEGTEGLWAVNRLVCDALRAGLQGASEAVAQAALGTYLAPLSPHGAAAERLAPALHDLARKFFHHLLRRGRCEKALSLAVELCAWDLCADARWAAAAAGFTHQPQLALEAAALAKHYAELQDSECSDTCSQCSSQSCSESEAGTSASSEARTKPPPLPRVPIPQNTTSNLNIIPVTQNPTSNPNIIPITQTPMIPQTPTMMPVPLTQPEPTSVNSIRPNLHQYLERENTIWNVTVRDDTHIKHDLKPILSQNVKWHSMDNFLSYKSNSKHSLLPISESSSKHMIPNDDKMTPAHFRHLLQTELREDVPNTLYRYQSSNIYLPSTSLSRQRYEDVPERVRTEKNKVKFSDTVTVAVVPERLGARASCPSPSRELADSLPLCAPHKYLAAFAPLPAHPAHPSPHPAPHPAPGTPLDYVEV